MTTDEIETVNPGPNVTKGLTQRQMLLLSIKRECMWKCWAGTYLNVMHMPCVVCVKWIMLRNIKHRHALLLICNPVLSTSACKCGTAVIIMPNKLKIAFL